MIEVSNLHGGDGIGYVGGRNPHVSGIRKSNPDPDFASFYLWSFDPFMRNVNPRVSRTCVVSLHVKNRKGNTPVMWDPYYSCSCSNVRYSEEDGVQLSTTYSTHKNLLQRNPYHQTQTKNEVPLQTTFAFSRVLCQGHARSPTRQ